MRSLLSNSLLHPLTVAVFAIAGVMVISTCDGGGNIVINPPPKTDFVATLSDFAPHIGQRLEARVIADNNQLQGYAIVEPLNSGDYTIRMDDLLAGNDYHLDFFADFDDDGGYDAPPMDHAWRYDIPGSGVLSIDHNTDFTDIASPPYIFLGGDFVMQFTDFMPHAGQLFELKLKNEDDRVVGYYRLGTVPANGQFTIRIPDIVVNGEDYTVDYYADYNGDGGYDAPPVDHAWRTETTGSGAGLNITIVHNTDFANIQF